MKKVHILLVTLLFWLTFDLSPANANANEGDVGYSIEPHIPWNQLDKRQTYFDLLMKPEQEQDLVLTIWNSSDEELDVKVAINNPITNRNGIVDYTKEAAEIDESLEIPITEIAKVDKEVITVPARSSKDVTVSLKMPEEEFDGVVLGGIYFEKVMDEEKQGKNVQIQNKYAYVVGLMLSENDSPVEPELYLKSVKPTLINYRTAIAANLQNSKPVIIKEMAVNATITAENGEEIISVERQDINMAPNSNMDFIIDWENKELKPGLYTVEMQANVDGQHWNWVEKFEIKKEAASTLNKEAVEIEEEVSPYINGGYSLIILVLLGVIFWLIQKNRKISTK